MCLNSWQTLSSAAGDPGALETFSNLGRHRIKESWFDACFLCIKKEALTLESLAIATAAKNSGGFVVVQVERIADRGTLNVRQVKIPSLMDFAPIIKDTPRLMDERIFRPEPMVLKEDLLTLTLEERLTCDAAENLFFVNFEGYAVQTGQEVEVSKMRWKRSLHR